MVTETFTESCSCPNLVINGVRYLLKGIFQRATSQMTIFQGQLPKCVISQAATSPSLG